VEARRYVRVTEVRKRRKRDREGGKEGGDGDGVLIATSKAAARPARDHTRRCRTA